MKSTDLRAKARAIFGSAIAEPMPNQPNGAKALQQRANARPIPTYKVGGVVKKADGGKMPKVSEAERKMGDALMMKRKGKEIMAAQAKRDAEKERMGMAKRAVADKLLGIPAKKDGGKAGGMYKKGGKAKDGLAVMIAIGKPMKDMKKPVKRAVGGVAPPPPSSSLQASYAAMNRPSSKPATNTAPAAQPNSAKYQEAVSRAMMSPQERGLMRMVDKQKASAATAREMKDMKRPVKRAVGGAGKTRKGMCK